MESESAVNRELDPRTQKELRQIPGWRGFNNPWLPDDDQAVDFSYVNLLENPERYTGYKVQLFPDQGIMQQPPQKGLLAAFGYRSPYV